MTQKWNLKVRDLLDSSVEHVASFASSDSANAYKSKLIDGSGGLFSKRYEILVEESQERKRGPNVRKEVHR
jgi:hypothetical protein